MWVKSEQGILYNMDMVDIVEVIAPAEGKYQVVGHMLSGQRIELTEVKENDIEPYAVYKRIMTSIIDNDRILDLEKTYSSVKRHRYQDRTR